ncbi:DUF4390 domain-containing protein [Methylomonas sp. EFPC3]|uniref:DUF4390 domain-containing protein n=1 Tax=Methylomonas sp. EFPC3 TaxID=3021710 RepID=UPI0024161D5C|nr:DUF4390 domain-containing protein [Methylomonas sp. EFPC3]WFP52215.1 DUF4390 domain-containing protein [Methylomonas sp. EFPC3]
MPSCAKRFSPGLFALCLALGSTPAWAGNYAARIEYAELQSEGDTAIIASQIEYRLSPVAKEALDKGVPLTWDVVMELREPGWLWDSVAYRSKQRYRLQFHALLNQYAVQTPQNHSEMFLTLSAALHFMASVRDQQPIPATALETGHYYQLAVRSEFNREALPIPLRPVAYLDHRWFLSSHWSLWPIQK